MDVGFDEFIGEIAAGAEVEEFEFVGRGVIEEVGPVGICLHEFELCDFAQAETEYMCPYPISLLLIKCLDFSDTNAVAEFCCEDFSARGFLDNGRDVENVSFVGEEFAEAGAHFRFTDVVAFPC